jgi:MFS family permease
VLALALWFSATAVLPALRAEYGLSDWQASLYTSAVQAGFVVGTVISALLVLADRVDPRRLFLAAALVGAGANLAIIAVAPTSPAVPLLRFVTGACLAGVYPVGMRIVASWAKGDMGLLVGLLVAALTLGSASPHLRGAFGGADWRLVLIGASASAVLGGLVISFVTLGPGMAPAPPFHPALALQAWRNVPLRLANAGYLGHMWELYAMWAWIGVFFDASFRLTLAESDMPWARLATFATVAAGAIGCFAGGWFADRVGRTRVTMIAMAVSGSCALIVGWLITAPPWLLLAICLVWGVAIVADSAQFSASVAELSDPGLVGTMLTVQTSAGFLLTLVTIHLIPIVVDVTGWGLAFALLAPGPFLGVLAMARLRAHPEAGALAGGRR